MPPGYNLGHAHMGKGSLWGLPELNLERTNRHGVTYRAVMHNLFVEIERCLRLGVAFDLVWETPGHDTAGYREIVRVRDDGQIEVRDPNGVTVLESPRPPPRPAGTPPALSLDLRLAADGNVTRVAAHARVTEGSAPVFYTVGNNRRGVYENAIVFW